MADLAGRVQALGVSLQRLFLDREFATVAVLDYLHTQPFVSVVALPKRGERLKALLTGRASSPTTDTMHSADDGEVTFPLWVAVRYAAGRRGQHGRDYLPFAVLGQSGCTLPVQQIADEYRSRFGIESRYRQAEQVRPLTTSRNPALRLLLVTVSLLLPNLWVWLKAQIVAHTPRTERRQVRAWLDAWFRLDRFCDLLLEALKATYHVRSALTIPFPLRTPLKL